MQVTTTALTILLLAGPARGGDDLAARLERLEARVSGLKEENRALRALVEALNRGQAVGPGATAAASIQLVAPPPVPDAARVPPAPASDPPFRVSVGGQVRMRPEFRNRISSGPAEHRDLALGQRTRASVAVESRRVKAFVEVQDARSWGTEASTVSNDRNVDLHQGLLSVPDLAFHGLSLTLGRQELAYGDERLVGALDWATPARSFDGGLARYAWKGGAADAFAAMINDRGTAARGKGDMVLSGLYGRFLRNRPGRDLDAYLLNLGDGARSAGEAGGSGTSRVTTLGLRARHWPASGIQVSAEGAWQSGHRGPDGHEAWAAAVIAGYAFAAPYRPTARVEWDAATGDGDPRDGRSREFHNLFPTNHPHYGYADLIGWRNMSAFRGTLSLAPREGHQLSLDLHRFRLRQGRGAWQDASGEALGHDPTGRLGTDLGDELDLLYRLPVRKDLTLLLGYSAFFPGRFAAGVGRGSTQSFGYTQVFFKF